MSRITILLSTLVFTGLLCSGCGTDVGSEEQKPTPLDCQFTFALSGPTAVSNAESQRCSGRDWAPGSDMIFTTQVGEIPEYPGKSFELQLGVIVPEGDTPVEAVGFFALGNKEGDMSLRWLSDRAACAIAVDEMVPVMRGEEFTGRNVRLHGSCTRAALPMSGNPDPRDAYLNDIVLEAFVGGYR